MDLQTETNRHGQKNAVSEPIPVSKYANRVKLTTLLDREDGGWGLIQREVVIGGWVESSTAKIIYQSSGGGKQMPMRAAGSCKWMKDLQNAISGGDRMKAAEPPRSRLDMQLWISDGSSVTCLMVEASSDLISPPSPADRPMPVGTCLLVKGVLHPTATKEAPRQGKIKLKATKLLHIGNVELGKYPLATKEQSRDYSHFRPRKIMSSLVTRIHSSLAFASHSFFQNQGFQYVQAPIITRTNAEGHGKVFNVTSLLAEYRDSKSKSFVSKHGGSTEANLAKTPEADVSEEFFACESFLTVSGRLHLASYACALGKAYSFGPRFRADHIDRHVAEMWDFETEMAFSEVDDAMNCAKDFLKFLCGHILDHHSKDMEFIERNADDTKMKQLQSMIYHSISRRSYKEVMMLLQMVPEQNFQIKPEWGVALTTEHLSFLTDKIDKGPVIIYDYPKTVKPFYVRLNDDRETVAAFDIVLPKVGILISGSQNEERLNKLTARIEELGLPRAQYEWYLDLHRHGAAKHSGFSLRSDLMVQFVTSLRDVSEAIPFPRSRRKADN